MLALSRRPPAAEQPPPRTARDAGGVPLDKIGSAVTVVTGDQLRAQQVRHAADALRSLPGVNVSTTGGPAGPTQVRLRGAEGNHTLVMIDGIEANATAAGEFDFAHLMTDDIERIEVIRGPQSGLYGSKAIGGVINIITKDGKGPFTASVRAEGGALRYRGRERPCLRRQRQGVDRRQRHQSQPAVLQYRPRRLRAGSFAPTSRSA